MKPLLLLLLLLCAPLSAATLSDFELLRSLAADQGAPVEELAKVPAAQAAPATREFEGLGTITAKSPWWQRPKAALRDRSFLPDGAKKPLWLSNGPAAGSRVWLKGEIEGGVLRVDDSATFPARSANMIPAKAEAAAFGVELAQVSPWCDHMPMMAKGERRQYLVIRLKLTNKTDQPLTVTLTRAFLSFDAASEGVKVAGIFLRAQNGRPSAQTALTLQPGTSLVELRGDGQYPEGRHGRTLYATLELSAGRKDLFVRGSGAVLATQ